MFKVIQGGNAKNLKEEHQTDEPCSLKKFEAFALEVCKIEEAAKNHNHDPQNSWPPRRVSVVGLDSLKAT